MISLICEEDCGAEIIVTESHRPFECWNCGRIWFVPNERRTDIGVPILDRAPTRTFRKLPPPQRRA
jgi:hypothetical protein